MKTKIAAFLIALTFSLSLLAEGVTLGVITVASSIGLTGVTFLSAVAVGGDNSSFVRLDVLDKFIAENREQFVLDAARAQGESLFSVATISEVPAEKQHRFFSLLQKNYSVIFPTQQCSTRHSAQVILDLVATL